MIKSVSIDVIGEKKTRNGVTINTLAEEVQKQLNALFATIKGAVVKVVQSVDFNRNEALITVVFDEQDKKPIKELK